MSKARALSASLEDYLEAIYHIVARKRAARARDIAEALGVSRSSVTGALRSLAGLKLVNYAPYDIITLTGSGRAAAEDVVHRHAVLREFFTDILLVDGKQAEAAACRMEHAVPDEVLGRLVRFIKLAKKCPRCGERGRKLAAGTPKTGRRGRGAKPR